MVLVKLILRAEGHKHETENMFGKALLSKITFTPVQTILISLQSDRILQPWINESTQELGGCKIGAFTEDI